MLVFALPLIALCALLFAWIFYKWSVYALPCLAGLRAAQFAFAAGAGWLGSVVVWGISALAVFALMRWLCARASHSAARVLLSVVFITPTMVVAYFIFDDLTAGHVPSEVWRQVLCIFGAGVMGLLAFVKLSEPEGE